MLSEIISRKVVEDIENASCKRKKFIFGQNIYTDLLLSNFTFDGVIDERAGGVGTPFVIHDLSDLPHRSIILVASGGQTQTAVEKCKSYGHEVIDYFTFLRYTKKACVPVRFNEHASRDFPKRKAELIEIYNVLEDNLSRDLFSKIIDFRVSLDIKNLYGMKERQDHQYFEPFLLEENISVFFDVGGFDGFTTRKFLEYSPVGRSVIFEPNKENYRICMEELGGDDRVAIHNFGLSEFNERGQMNGDGSDSGALIDGIGDIEFKRLDDLQLPKPSLIKMDIEGGEMAALRGAERVILSSGCSLAISSYHSFSQLIDIPRYLMSLAEYKVFFRHYTESIYESVFFFIPR